MCLYISVSIYMIVLTETITEEQLLMEVLSSAHPKTRIFILGCHFTRVKALSLSLINLFTKQSCILDRLPDSTE